MSHLEWRQEVAKVDRDMARELIALNNRFYAEHADSFSATRSAPWEGWRRLLPSIRGTAACGERPVHVLDLACGNLRFERFLLDELPDADWKFLAIDNCADLARTDPAAEDAVPRLSFQNVDFLGELLVGCNPLAGAPAADLAACFGFMHHVPGRELRSGVVNALVGQTRPGGLLVLSFWQFMDDERLARKARAADARAAEAGQLAGALEAGDHFLGWQDDARALRYCHHFAESEIDDLVRGLAPRAREVARFSADGKSGQLNRYVLLERG